MQGCQTNPSQGLAAHQPKRQAMGDKRPPSGGIVVADYTNADAFTPPRYRTVADCEAQDIRDARARAKGQEVKQ